MECESKEGPEEGAAAEHKVGGLLVENHPCVPSLGSSTPSTPLLLVLRSHKLFQIRTGDTSFLLAPSNETSWLSIWAGS